MRPETLAVHAGGAPDAQTGAMAPPLHLATTFAHGPAGERVAGYEYTREGNPTQDRLEDALTAMEGGAAALAFASGMAAVVALLESLPAGSEVLIPRDCYTGVRMLGEEVLPARGISVRMAEFGDVDALRAALTPATKLLWAETPSNPQLQVADIAALERFILEQLTPIAGIEKIRSSFALKQVRYKTALPLPGTPPAVRAH